VIGANGSGKSTLLRIMAGSTRTSSARPGAKGATPSATCRRSPSSTRQDVRGNVEEGVAGHPGAARRVRRRSAKLGEPMPDDEMTSCSKQAELQDKIDALDAWDLDRTLESRWTRCAARPATPT
jgi:sulfate-transporting ATPase